MTAAEMPVAPASIAPAKRRAIQAQCRRAIATLKDYEVLDDIDTRRGMAKLLRAKSPSGDRNSIRMADEMEYRAALLERYRRSGE